MLMPDDASCPFGIFVDIWSGRVYNSTKLNRGLQGRVKFPIGGIVRERVSAGFGVIPKPTV